MTELTIENESGKLMFWIKVNGKITDLVMLSELIYLPDLSNETKAAIDSIYAEMIKEREEE